MKRFVSLVVAVVGMVAAGLVAASPAAAHPAFHSITLTGSMSITDQDWPDSDDYGRATISGHLTLSEAVPTASARFQGCADEVRVVVDVSATHSTVPFASGIVTVRTATRLYEGGSCATTDLEKTILRTFTVPAYGNRSDAWTIDDSGNKGFISLTVQNRQ